MNKRFKQINTGQKFPEGIDLHFGECEQCGRIGQQCSLRLELRTDVNFFDVTLEENENKVAVNPLPPTHTLEHVCAECMADFVSGVLCNVLAKTGGQWRQLKGEPR